VSLFIPPYFFLLAGRGNVQYHLSYRNVYIRDLNIPTKFNITGLPQLWTCNWGLIMQLCTHMVPPL
jgi:hypothetical protein